MLKMKKYIVGSSLFLLPVLALAQANATGDLTTISGVINRLQNVINLIIPFLVGLAVLVIIYGVFGFISNAADEEARASAKQFIIWGIIGVFIMLSVWGLVTILKNSFGTDASGARTDAVDETVIPVVVPGTGF